MSPFSYEKLARENLIKKISDTTSVCGKSARAVVFGSFSTGLYIPTSDIDIVILDADVSNPLYALARALRKKGLGHNMQLITKARVFIFFFKSHELLYYLHCNNYLIMTIMIIMKSIVIY